MCNDRIIEAAQVLVSSWDTAGDPDEAPIQLGLFCQELADAVHARFGPSQGISDMIDERQLVVIPAQHVRLLLAALDDADAVEWGQDSTFDHIAERVRFTPVGGK